MGGHLIKGNCKREKEKETGFTLWFTGTARSGDYLTWTSSGGI